jgi:hypothetical protein
MMASMHARTKNVAVNLGLLLGSLVIFFGGAELALRLGKVIEVNPPPPQIYARSENPIISYQLRAGISEPAFKTTVTTNSLGFRSPELDERPVIAVLGDSITFGHGVEDTETLPAQLGAVINEYQFVNAGVPGYNLRQETATFTDRIAELNPAAIVLVFFPNDLDDLETAVLADDGSLHMPGDKPATETCHPIETGLLGLLPGRCWLDRHSAFYTFVKKLVQLIGSNRQLEEEQNASRENPEEDPVTFAQLRRYERELDAFVAALPRNLPRLFIIWPDRNLHTESRPEIRRAAEERGFAVVDLYDHFGNEMETLLWDTVHPHPDAIKEAALYIKESVEALAEK